MFPPLQMEVTNEIIRQRKGAHIKTDLAVFASPEMVKVGNLLIFYYIKKINRNELYNSNKYNKINEVGT